LQIHFDTVNVQRFNDTPLESTINPENSKITNDKETIVSDDQQILSAAIESECLDCRATFEDPNTEDLYQYLHAYSYKSNDWFFKTEIPNWVQKIFGLSASSIPDLSDELLLKLKSSIHSELVENNSLVESTYSGNPQIIESEHILFPLKTRY